MRKIIDGEQVKESKNINDKWEDKDFGDINFKELKKKC